MQRGSGKGHGEMQKKLALINDIAGFGRCAVTVSLPIISYLGVQCCPVPTAVFSNHTGYPNYFVDDYTDRMEEYIENWKKLGLSFEGIATGFLGSVRQIGIVKDFIKTFSKNDTIVIVDPIMGDNGRLYPACTVELQREMRKLVEMSDVVTPNLTESCYLTGMSYRDSGWSRRELCGMAERLSEMGPSKVVITGIRQGDFIANYIYVRGEKPCMVRTRKVGLERSGTGDVFSSIIAADAVNGVPFLRSVRKAAGFVKKCMAKSIELDIPKTDGVCFEEILYQLNRR